MVGGENREKAKNNFQPLHSRMSNNEDIYVSICIPVYNGEQYIENALDSIVTQTYKNREIIVSDNVSTDKTADIVQKYVRKYGLKYSRSTQHFPAGECHSNRCFQLAKGELIAVYHADDIYSPDIVNDSVELFRNHENVGVVLTMANIINESGKIIGQFRLPRELKKLKKRSYNFDEIFTCILRHGNSFLFCPSAMFRKSVYDAIGGWDYERYKIAADLGLWLKAAQKYDIGIIDVPLMNYRISRHQVSNLLWRQKVKESDLFLVMDDYTDRIEGHKFEKYYDLLKIKDLLDRALNLSVKSRIGESNYLIKKILILYFKNFLKIGAPSLKHSFTAIVLLLVNRFTSDEIRIVFRNSIFRINNAKKRLPFLIRDFFSASRSIKIRP